METDEPGMEENKPGNPDSKVLTPWQQERLNYLREHDEAAELPYTGSDVKKEGEVAADDSPNSGLKVVKGGLLKEVPPVQKNEDATETEPSEFEESKEEKELKDLPKSKSFADKLPKLKETRKKRLQRRLTILVGSFGLAALGMIYYVSPLSNLDQIIVEGNEHVSDESVAYATKLTRKDRIWTALFKPGTEKKIKAANPRVKTVKVGLTHFNSLKLTVTEFKEVAYIKDKDILHPVLENGKILNETSEVIEPDYPILIGFTEGVTLDHLLEKYPEVDAEIRSNIEEIKSTPEKRNKYLMTIKMADGNQILTSSKDYYTKINYYPEVAAKLEDKGVIDMEAGVYFTSYEALKKQETTESSLNSEDNLE